MTIFVFADLGGKNLLGKARELADNSGDRIVAFTSKNSPEETQQQIYFGADEVLTCGVSSLNEWACIVCDQVQSDAKSKLVLFPSNILSNALIGMICVRGREKFSPLVDQAELVEEDSVGKMFSGSTLVFRKKYVPEKVTLCSVRSSSISPPFEDSFRFGKVRAINSAGSSNYQESDLSLETILRSSSDVLTILIGRNVQSATKEFAERLAGKYCGVAKKYSNKIEIIYGPCVAIEIDAKVRDLPEFKGELISISRSVLPITSLSDSSIVTKEIDLVLENLVIS